jgi:hypothetical protein
MVRCIYCGVEIEGSTRDHLAEKHLGIKKDASRETLQIAPTPPITQESTKENTTALEKTEGKEIPKSLKSEKPKKRYLDAAEIITLLQNTNKQFPLNELAGCPLTKENE